MCWWSACSAARTCRSRGASPKTGDGFFFRVARCRSSRGSRFAKKEPVPGFPMSEKIFERLNDSSGVYFEGELIERRETPFQLLEVYETRELGRIFRLDGFNMTSERDEFFYHENLVHPAACAHPRPRRALVIGGGDAGSSEELLKHPSLERVHMVELDPVVIEIA